MEKIRKGDVVVVLTGKDKGKTGVVTRRVDADYVTVEGVNVAKRHLKPRRPGEDGGIIKKETPIYASKVMRVCPKCGKPTREAHKFLADGTKARLCKKCGEII